MSKNFTHDKRSANLHESNSYWDNDDMVWRRKNERSYDDETNDIRPEDKKSNYLPVILANLLLLLLLLGLSLGLMKILNNIVTN